MAQEIKVLYKDDSSSTLTYTVPNGRYAKVIFNYINTTLSSGGIFLRRPPYTSNAIVFYNTGIPYIFGQFNTPFNSISGATAVGTDQWIGRTTGGTGNNWAYGPRVIYLGPQDQLLFTGTQDSYHCLVIEEY